MRTVNLMEELHLHCTIESVALRYVFTGKRFYALDAAVGRVRFLSFCYHPFGRILPWASSIFLIRTLPARCARADSLFSWFCSFLFYCLPLTAAMEIFSHFFTILDVKKIELCDKR